MLIRITPRLAIDENDIAESFIRASGPGGQNVNKVSTAVQLRFDVAGSRQLSPEIKARLARLAGRRMTGTGELIIIAGRYRTQERNRADALGRLIALLKDAAIPPVPRRPTRPTLGSKRRHSEAKRKRSAVKKLRGRGGIQDTD